MDLTIIIVNYNTGKLVSTCVDKILVNTKNLTYPKSEIIIIENASPDEPVGNLSKFAKIIRNTENLGFSKANNQGIKIAQGRHVVLINSDTEIQKGSLKELVDFADRNKDAGVIGARLILPSGEVQKSVFRFPTVWRAVQEFIFGIKDTYSSYAPSGDKPVVVESLVGAVFLITNRALSKVGLLDERYFMYFEDLDYCKRVNDLGLKVYYLPEVEFIHHHGASGKKLADNQNQWKRLVPSSIIYHGFVKHTLITWILKIGQRLR